MNSKRISQGYFNLFCVYVVRNMKLLEGIGNINENNTIYWIITGCNNVKSLYNCAEYKGCVSPPTVLILACD